MALSDGSGEVEWWKLPANGVGDGSQLTKDGKTLRCDGLRPRPTAKWLASTNKDQELWLLEVATRAAPAHRGLRRVGRLPRPRMVARPRWLAYVRAGAEPAGRRSCCTTLKGGATTALTSERWDSRSPAWSPTGSGCGSSPTGTSTPVVRSIWGSRQPDPFFDKPTQVFGLALREGHALALGEASTSRNRRPIDALARRQTKPAGGKAADAKGDAKGDAKIAGAGDDHSTASATA